MGRLPKNKEMGEENEQLVKDISSNQLGNILKQNKEDHLNFEKRVEWKISSGSLLLDSALGGYINPCLLRLCGANNEGKTPQALEIVRNFLKDVPNSRCIWVLSEGRGLTKENKERCGLPFTTNYEEWQDGNIMIIEANIYEFIIKMIKDLVLKNEEKKIYAFVIDSIDGLILRNDVDKSADDAMKVAGPALLSKKMLQSLSLGMFKYGHLMILVSQVTSEIKLDMYSKTPNRGGNFSGGNALLHASDFIMDWQSSYNSDYILDNSSGKLNDGKSKPVGKWSKVVLQKSAIETTRKQLISYPIKFGRKPSGIWREYELANLLIAWSMVIKAEKGAWLTLTEDLRSELKQFDEEIPEKVQGETNLKEYLESKPEITEYLFNKFKNLLSS